MDLLVVIGALALLMLIAYRGYSVVLFAPVVALGAVFFFEPIAVFPSYMALFMEKTSFFVKMYFPMFLLGAIFGKVIELSGFSKSIVSAVFKLVGVKHATLAIIIVTASCLTAAYRPLCLCLPCILLRRNFSAWGTSPNASSPVLSG